MPENTSLRADAMLLFRRALGSVQPAVFLPRVLPACELPAHVSVLSIGKAGWQMAHAFAQHYSGTIDTGLVITKYRHSQGDISGFSVCEAGHPVPDRNGIRAGKLALEMVRSMDPQGHLVFLVSGGGSALFEVPEQGVSLEQIADVTSRLLRGGASIVEINTIRKRLSAVKGGKFAQLCGSRRITALVLSDVLGDRLDTIASGPVTPDSTTVKQAMAIVKRYDIPLSEQMQQALQRETPKELHNVSAQVTGSLRVACQNFVESATRLGYEAQLLTTTLDCQARHAGCFLASIAREVAEKPLPSLVLAGGETVVQVKGKGKGGRNQELALSAALGIEGLQNVVVAALGTDGSDGPTDAAGGIVDGNSTKRMRASGHDPVAMLDNNDAYHALSGSGDLVVTGPTGTNVNDLYFVLCSGQPSG
ncbi:MAG TPA: glycerate kinase [Thermotogota bacterium]|nr:glycerate kinase [Thermotogota bacterium]